MYCVFIVRWTLANLRFLSCESSATVSGELHFDAVSRPRIRKALRTSLGQDPRSDLQNTVCVARLCRLARCVFLLFARQGNSNNEEETAFKSYLYCTCLSTSKICCNIKFVFLFLLQVSDLLTSCVKTTA